MQCSASYFGGDLQLSCRLQCIAGRLLTARKLKKGRSSVGRRESLRTISWRRDGCVMIPKGSWRRLIEVEVVPLS